MARATYTDADKAKVYVVLITNEGNVKRTARETGVPEATVRRWKQEWEQDGPPNTEEVELAAGDWLEVAADTRWLAIQDLRRQIQEGRAKPGELNAIIGTLTDKIDRAAGIALGRVEHKVTLPSPEELRAALTEGLLKPALALAQQRQEEIIDAEFVEEQPALPAGK